MKTILKTSLALSAILLGTFSVSADETSSETTWTEVTWTETVTQTGMTRDEFKQKMQEERKTLHTDVKQNLRDFRTQSGTLRDHLNLSDEDKAKVDALRAEHKASADALKAEYDAKIKAATTAEEKDALRNELRDKMQALWESFYSEMKELVPQNDEVHTYVDARKAVFEENQALRKASLEKRKELRGERANQILAHKEKFVKTLGSKITTIVEKKPERVETIVSKIDAMIAKFEANTKLSETNKQKILDQLKALKELVEDAVSENEIESEMK